MSKSVNIDWEFIAAREGGNQLDAYVPEPTKSKSGVTVATGVDIGQRSADDIERLNIPTELQKKLKPYAQHKGTDAENFLAKNPLQLTQDEANCLNKAVKESATSNLISSYNAASKKIKFEELPLEAQTVIASVAFHYGNLKTKAPKFWNAVIQQNWNGADNELRNFGDNYKSRRLVEAELLKSTLIREASKKK